MRISGRALVRLLLIALIIVGLYSIWLVQTTHVARPI
jgi:hypothetical protein